MRPRLKDVAWERVGSELRVVYDLREQLMLTDRDGTVERLLSLLREGTRTIAELASALSMPASEVGAAVAVFDEYRLLEDGDRLGRFERRDAERYHSNLAFFESFASLARGREDFQRALTTAHVLVLGTGGLGGSTIAHLCGLGVGRLTLLDHDTVEPRNFARQYLYRWSDIGSRKATAAAAWVEAFDPSIDVRAIDGRLTGADEVAALLTEVGPDVPDVVVAAVDSPVEIDRWVNEACVRRRVPFVRAGIWVTEGRVWSVDPGRSACLACVAVDLANQTADQAEDLAGVERAGARLFGTKAVTNRAIGPVAGLLGAMVGFEVLRFLTGFEPPAYAGKPLVVDFAGGCATRQAVWRRNPGCAVCGSLVSAGTAEPSREEVTR